MIPNLHEVQVVFSNLILTLLLVAVPPPPSAPELFRFSLLQMFRNSSVMYEGVCMCVCVCVSLIVLTLSEKTLLSVNLSLSCYLVFLFEIPIIWMLDFLGCSLNFLVFFFLSYLISLCLFNLISQGFFSNVPSNL